MATFSESSFAKKLEELNGSQQSIQTLSLWLIHHRKRARVIVDIWAKELKKARPNKKMVLIYLANDVVQNSRKKGADFIKAYQNVMYDAYRQTAKDVDEKTKESMARTVKIWEDRKIFSDQLLNKLKQALEKKSDPPKKKKKKEVSLLEEIEISMVSDGDNAMEEVQAEDLVHALEELANSASSDAAVRESIAALPPELSDASLLKNVKDRQTAELLSKQAEDAKLLLEDYNKRLGEELDNRKTIAKQLRQYINSQKEALNSSEKNLQEYRAKLAQVSSIRKDLVAHLQSLPDMTQFPVDTSLAPLPSAGDLFSL